MAIEMPAGRKAKQFPGRVGLALLALAWAGVACRSLPSQLPGLVNPTPAAGPAAMVSPQPSLTASPPPTPGLPSATPAATVTMPPAPTAAAGAEQNLFHEGRSTETDEAGQYSLELRYPQLYPVQAHAAPEFNQAVLDLINRQVNDFKLQAAGLANTQPDLKSTLGLDYSVFYAQQNRISLQFRVDRYMQGAAHPGLESYPLNYDLAAGQPLHLKDLFLPDSHYLELLSRLCIADLQGRAFPLILAGAAPAEENFRSWNLTPQALRITFDAYQVGPYAAGPQVVEIPWKTLQAILSAVSLSFLLQP